MLNRLLNDSRVRHRRMVSERPHPEGGAALRSRRVRAQWDANAAMGFPAAANSGWGRFLGNRHEQKPLNLVLSTPRCTSPNSADYGSRPFKTSESFKTCLVEHEAFVANQTCGPTRIALVAAITEAHAMS